MAARAEMAPGIVCRWPAFETEVTIKEPIQRGFPVSMLVLVVALGAAGASGYYAYTLWTEREAMNEQVAAAADQAARAEDAEGQNAELSRSLDECKGELEQQTARCSSSEAAIESLREDLNATRAELDEVRKQRTEAAKQLAAFKELTTKFRRMIDSGQVDVVVRNGRMMVKLPARVLFEPGKVELSRDGELALMEVAVGLRNYNDRRFMVIGHTDDRPREASETRFQSNWELSAARAVTVVNFLVEARMKPENLLAAGLAGHDPITENKTPAGRRKNRRIEIVMLPNLAALPKLPPELGSGEEEDAKEETGSKPGKSETSRAQKAARPAP